MHDNQNFHWLYGIEEIFIYFDYDLTQLKLLTDAVLHGKMSSVISLMKYEENLDNKTQPIRMKVITEYWNTNCNDADILQYVVDLTDNAFFSKILLWIIKYPNIKLHDHFGRGQLKSKLWFVDILWHLIANHRLGNVALYGGWYGSINWFLNDQFNIKHTYNFEIDKFCISASENLNDSNFTAIECDVSTLEWDSSNLIINNVPTKMGVIINTSAEHMDDKWFDAIPKGQFVILQTNNFFECDQHVNCVPTLKAAIEKYQMTSILFSDELETMKYTRFMIAGIK